MGGGLAVLEMLSLINCCMLQLKSYIYICGRLFQQILSNSFDMIDRNKTAR